MRRCVELFAKGEPNLPPYVRHLCRDATAVIAVRVAMPREN
jgi:hypothetical protein